MPSLAAPSAARPLRCPPRCPPRLPPRRPPAAGGGPSDKGEDDRARARRFKQGLADFSAQEKAYVQGKYRWVARQHARAQMAVKKAVEKLRAEWQEDPAAGAACDDDDDYDDYGCPRDAETCDPHDRASHDRDASKRRPPR